LKNKFLLYNSLKNTIKTLLTNIFGGNAVLKFVDFVPLLSALTILIWLAGIILTILLFVWVYQTRKMVKEIHSQIIVVNKNQKNSTTPSTKSKD